MVSSVLYAATITVCKSGCDHVLLQSGLNAASAGDTIKIQDSETYNGEYEYVTWTVSGSDGSPIVLVASSGNTPLIDTKSFTFQGSYLEILGSATGYGTITRKKPDPDFTDAFIVSGDYNTIRNITIDSVNAGRAIYIPTGGDHNVIDNIVMDVIDYATGAQGGSASGIWIAGNYNIVQSSSLLTACHDDVMLRGPSSYNIVRNNYFENAWGHGIVCEGNAADVYTSYNLIEGNTFKNIASLADDDGKNCVQIAGANHITIRKNIFDHPYRRCFEISNYNAATEYNEDIWIYNNVFYDIGWHGIQRSCEGVVQHNTGYHFDGPPVVEGGTLLNCRWYNNIFEKVGQCRTYGYGYCSQPFQAIWILGYFNGCDTEPGCGSAGLASNDWDGNVLKNNCIRPYFSGSYQLTYDSTIVYSPRNCECAEFFTPIGANGVGSASGNITGAPLFTNPGTGDFTLQSGSSCIDSGVVVVDSNAVVAGWDTLVWYGNAPDIGAYEYAGAADSCCNVVPSSINFGNILLLAHSDTTITITNCGDSTVIDSVYENAAHYSIISGGGSDTLAADESANVVIRFAPTTVGTKACTLQTSNDLCGIVIMTGVGYEEEEAEESTKCSCKRRIRGF